MEKDPDRRYQTAGAMAEDLRRYVNRFAISARRVGPVGKSLKWVRRHPGVTTGIVCAVLANIVAAFFANRAREAEKHRMAEQAQSRNQIATIERDHALQNALIAATSGDLDKAEAAINEAELKGASSAQLRVLRGQVAYFRGDLETALRELEQAMTLGPTSVASRGMLALSYLNFGNWTRYIEEVIALDKLEPKTGEDFLFKGYALAGLKYDAGVKLLDRAVELSRSPLARAVRADARLNTPYALPERIAEVQKAAKEIAVAKEFLPDNLYTLSVSLSIHVYLAMSYREAGQTDDAQAALELAAADARALSKWATLPSSAFPLWLYYGATDQEEEQFRAVRLAAEASSNVNIKNIYAVALCRDGRFAEALRVLNERAWPELWGDELRVYVLAELYPHDLDVALKAAEENRERHRAYVQLEQTYGEVDGFRHLLCLLGQKAKAVASYREALQNLQPDAEGRHRRVLEFGSGKISEDDLLKMEGDDYFKFKNTSSAAYFRLADGDRDGARKLFEQATKHYLFLNFNHELNMLILCRMNQDPNWPSWIPVKE
jgi:tetratricopeptide (TPR) repeat protein